MGEARGGYEAEIVCNKVQVLRPSSSTSGGQSGGGATDAVSTAGGEDVSVVVCDLSLEILFFIIAAQSAEEVQVRQL